MAETHLVGELQHFGLSAGEKNVIEKLQLLREKWNIDTVTLVEKYVAFQRNADLSDQISLKDVECFDRETSAKYEMNKYKIPKPKTPRNASNLLTKNMLQELLVSETQNDQRELLTSYGICSSKIISEAVSGVTQLLNNGCFRNKTFDCLDNNSLSQPFNETGILCVYSIKQNESLVSAQKSTDWIINLLEANPSANRYMNQHALEKSEVLDNWTWTVVKRILQDLPDGEFPDINDTLSTFSLTPNQFSQTNSHEMLPQSDTSNGTIMERSMTLRPAFSRLQTPSWVAGRIAVKSSLLLTDSLRESQVDVNSQVLGKVKQHLQISNAGLVGLRRFERVVSTDVIPLDFIFPDNKQSFSIHSGQPVLMRAVNPTGLSLGVNQILTACIPRPPELTNDTWGNLHVMVACGPYTLSDTHNPTALFNLLHAVKEIRPHVLILIGPIVDSEHPSIDSYSESTYEELFQSRLNSVAEWCSHLSIKLVVVSSWQELHHDPVFPTPPIDKYWTQKSPELIKWYENVQFVPDPCLLKIGDYVFGITSVDVLRHLSSEEISSGCSGDRISRLCRHLLSSSSFYPVHPPSDELPLDYLLWDQHAQLTVTPHCMIVPSRLRQFAKDIDGVLFVNPGHVSRGQALGSYGEIIIYGNNTSVSVNDDNLTQLSESDGSRMNNGTATIDNENNNNNNNNNNSNTSLCGRSSVCIRRM